MSEFSGFSGGENRFAAAVQRSYRKYVSVSIGFAQCSIGALQQHSSSTGFMQCSHCCFFVFFKFSCSKLHKNAHGGSLHEDL